MEQEFKTFLKTAGKIFVILMVTSGSFSLLADAYGLFGIRRFNRINHISFREPDYSMESKIFSATKTKPRTIILGSSRAEVGLNPDYNGFKHQPVFNLGIPKIRMRGIRKLFEHFVFSAKPKETVIALDFYMFNTLLPDRGEDIAGLLGSHGICRQSMFCYYFSRIPFLMGRIWSLRTFKNSFDVFYYSVFNKEPQKESFSPHNQKGLRISLRNHLDKFPQRAVFWAYEIYYLFGDMWLDSKRKFEFINPKTKIDAFEELKTIFNLAHQKNIKIHIVILPSHARLWETMNTLDLGDKFEQWKTQMVSLNEEIAEKRNKKPFNVWDFSGYNHITAETVPPIGDKTARMKNYLDNSHFIPEIGDLVLDIVMGIKDSEKENFGRRLTKEEIYDDITDMMLERNIWLTENISDALEINLLYNDKRNRDIIKDPFLDMDN